MAHIEDSVCTSKDARYPYFSEILWYVLDRYAHCLLGKTNLDLPEEEKRRIRLEKGENIDPNQEVFKIGKETKDSAEGQGIVNPNVHITQSELHGIKFIIMYLHSLPTNKKSVPIMLPDPIAVVKNVKEVVSLHKDDCPEQAITGNYILKWTENDDFLAMSGFKKAKRSANSLINTKASQDQSSSSSVTNNGSTSARRNRDTGSKAIFKKFAAGNRRRRVRCKTCDACLGDDCKVCVYCKDMVKYGGPGKMKQTCEKVSAYKFLCLNATCLY